MSGTELDPLLPPRDDGSSPPRKHWYRARPLWMVPFFLAAAISRGMTLAPRVQVFRQLSCEVLRDPSPTLNHTSIALSLPSANPLPCIADPAVQAGATRLLTIIMTVSGLLSALTTVWWGNTGEKIGRTKILAISSFGLFVTDFVFLSISSPGASIGRQGHNLLYIASVIEGLCGGWSTLQAAVNAYVSDCTSHGSRSNIFSRFAGVFFLGLSLGPEVGALIIKYFPASASGIHASAVGANDNVAPVFMISAGACIVNMFLALFVFPESIYKNGKLSPQLTAKPLDGEVPRSVLSSVKSFFAPLSVFLPYPRINGTRDYSLTYVASALLFYLLGAGVYQIKYQYAQNTYELDAVHLSYYVSLLAGSRAVMTLLVLPWIISLLKPKAAAALPDDADDHTKQEHLAEEISFDLSLMKYSLLIDFISHASVALASTSSVGLFSFLSVLSALSAGSVPAAQSIALCILHARGEEGMVGKLFGGVALLQAVGQMIVGPFLFGMLYSSTVGIFPKAMFYAAASILLLAIISITLVRGQKSVSTEGAQERGRSRNNKQLAVSVRT